MRFTYASALLGATLASVASADDWNTWPHFVDSVQADIANVGDFENPSAPARVWNGDTVTYTFSGDNLAEGDSVFWTADGNCLNPSGVATLSAGKTASFSLSAGTYHLCYQFNDEYYTPQKPYNYYGNSFTLNVVDVTSVSDTSPYTNQNLEVSVSGVNLLSSNENSASNDAIRFTTGDCTTPVTIGGSGSTGLEQGGSIVLDFLDDSDVEMCIKLAGQSDTTEWHKTDIEWDIQAEAGISNHLRMVFPFICNAACAAEDFTVYGPNVRSGDKIAIVQPGDTLVTEDTITADSNELCDEFFENAGTYVFNDAETTSVATNIVTLTLNSNGWATGTLTKFLLGDGTGVGALTDITPTICVLPVDFDVLGVDAAPLMLTNFEGLNAFEIMPTADHALSSKIDIISDVYVYTHVWAENSAYSSTSYDDLAIYTSDTSDTYWYFGLADTNSILVQNAFNADPAAVKCDASDTNFATPTITGNQFSLAGGDFTADTTAQFCLDTTTADAGDAWTIEPLTEPVWADFTVFAPRLFAKMSTASFAISDGDETAEAFLADGDVQLVATSGGTAADERGCVDAAIGLWLPNANDEDFTRSTGTMGDVGTVGFCAQEDNTYRTQLKPTPYTATVVTVNVYPSAGPAAAGSGDSIGTLTFADYPASTKFVIDDVCADTTDDGSNAKSFADTVTIDDTSSSFIASGKICAFDSDNSMWVDIGSYAVGTPSASIGDVYAHVGQEISGGSILGAGVQPGDEIIVTDVKGDCAATTAPTAIATPSISIENGVGAEFGAFTINEVIKEGDVCLNFGNEATSISTADNVRVIQIDNIEVADLTVYAKAGVDDVTIVVTDTDDVLDVTDEFALQNADGDCEDLTGGDAYGNDPLLIDMPDVGGAYKWCLSVAGQADFYDTGFDLQVVSFGTSYPAKTLFEEDYEIFISGSGFKTGDSVIAVADCTNIASFDDTLPVSFTASTTGSEAGVAVIDFPSDAAIGTYSLCYQSTVYESDAADASAQWVDSGKTVQVVATTDTTAHDTFDEAFVLYDSMDGTFSDTTTDTASRNGDQFTVLNPGTACNSAEFDANIVAEVTSSGIGHASQEITLNLVANNEEYQLCSLNNGAADETAFVAAGTIQVSSLTSLDPDWVLSTTATQDDEITLGGVGLFNGNSVTFTMGAATTGAQILSDNSVVDDAASAKITVDQSGAALAGGDYDVYYTVTGSTSAADTGLVFSVVSVSICPMKVIATSEEDTERTIQVYGSNLDDNDQVIFAASCGESADGAQASGGEAVAVSSFDDGASVKVCFRSALTSDAAPVAEDFIEVTGLSVGIEDDRFITHSPVRLVSGVATRVTFSGTTQAGDSAKAILDGEDCDGTVGDTEDETPTTVGAVGTINIEGECGFGAEFTITTAQVDATEPETKHLPVCYKPVAPAPAEGETGFEVVDSGDDFFEITELVDYNPKSIYKDNFEQITFEGIYLMEGDFASFVAEYYDDCDKSWVYEQAIDANMAAWFKLPAGLYHTCFWHVDTITGYEMYSMNLAVKGISGVSPSWTSANRVTDFELTSSSETAPLTGMDTVGFVPNSDDCSNADSEDYEANVRNVTVTSDSSDADNVHDVYMALDVTLNAAGSWAVCSNFEESVSWNNDQQVSEFDDNHVLSSAITVDDLPMLGLFAPNHVVAGDEEELTFIGSFLGNDDVTFLAAPNATCTNETVDAFGMPTTAGSDASVHSATLTSTWETIGEYLLCYRYSETQPDFNPVNPDNSQDLSLYVVDVESVAPTSVMPTAGADGETELTLHGYFGMVPGSNWATFVDVADDCEAADESADKQWVEVATGGMTASAMFNVTDMAGEYKLCIKFTGRDHWEEYADIEVSARQISAITPASIVNGVDSMISFTGFGLKDGDYAQFMNTSDATQTCDTASNETASMVMDKKATFNLGSGDFSLCYKFGELPFEAITVDNLLVEPAVVKTITPTTASAGVSATFAVTGTGLADGDSARLVVNATENADCATKEGSSIVQVDGEDNMYSFTIGPELTASVHQLCYQFGADSEWMVFPAIQVSVSEVVTVGGNFPRKAMTPGALDITLVGSGLAGSDKAEFTMAADCAGVTGIDIGFSNSQEEVTVNQDFASNGKYHLCYQHQGQATFTSYSMVTVTISDFNATNCADGEFMCDGVCQAESCPATAGCADPAKYHCSGSGLCVRTPSQCPPVDSECANLVCPGGECVEDLAECDAGSACPATHIRCLDGSCAPANTGCFFRGAAIEAPVCETEGTVVSEAHGICYPAAAGKPDFNGCPPSQAFQCGTCTCAASLDDCPKTGDAFTCLDGSSKAKAHQCSCEVNTPVAKGSFKTAVGAARRFVVKANAAATVQVKSVSGTAATLTLPANSIVQNGCVVNYGPISSTKKAAAAKAQEVDIASAAIHFDLKAADGSVCSLAAPATVQFASVSVPAATGNDTATVACIAFKAGETNPTVSGQDSCVFNSKLSSAAVVLGTPEDNGSGTVSPTPIPTPTPDAGSNPGSGGSTGSGSGSGSSSGSGSGSGDDDVDSASVVSASVVAVLVVLASML